MQQILDLASQIGANQSLRDNLMINPEETLRTFAAGSPLQTDAPLYRMVVFALGYVLCAAVTGALILGFYGKPVPAEVTALGSAAIGAIGALLVVPPKQQS